ncbi:MAG: diacylglycerol/lipid kinase family protein, partial [Terriglobales bacterium]
MSDETFLAIVNPAAGGGRCRKLVGPAIERLRSGGIEVEVAETTAPGHATELARDAYRNGRSKFISVGGDGTSFEIVNGLFPEAQNGRRPTLAFLPLGTGNSFLRDFSDRGADHSIEALLGRHARPCDVLRLTHSGGIVYYTNLLSMGFSADVATMRARHFGGWGELGYQSSILISLARFRRRAFPLKVDGEDRIDQRPCLFLTFSNSKFTGG